MIKFTHLHVHSHYSLLDGLTKIDELLDYTKELGMDSLAITDHGVMYGAVEFFEKATARGVKPIIGCEVYVANESMLQKRPGIDDKRYHLILLVKNEEGYKNLVQLVTRAHLDGFYYKPRIDDELLEKHSSGLIAQTACLAGRIPNLIMAKKIEEAETLALKYQKIFGKDNFYLEIQYHKNLKEQKIVNDALIKMSRKLDIPLVATNDIHYLRPEDAEAQDILMLINTGADPNDPERLSMKTDNFCMRKPEEMAELFKDTPDAISNTQKIADMCNFQFELGKTKLPHFETPDNKDPNKYIKELCLQGAEKRGLGGKKEVLERLEYELSVIEKTGFGTYFLIVQDFINWAKQNGIVVGPGRGSAPGSIVSYLLGITNVDPLKYNLLFERFLNPERISFPDIDMDFTDTRRDEVIEYVAQKYGRNRVAQIITFGTMAARAAIRDVGRATGMAYSFCDQVAKMIPVGFTLDDTLNKISEFKQLYISDSQARNLIDFAKKLEGVARHASTHACGVVISKDPLENTVPLQHPTQSEQGIVTQYEMHCIEDLGLLKMDFLGLKNLTIIESALKIIKKNHDTDINIDNIPFDDKKTYKLLQQGNTAGIFQLEGGGMTRYLVEMKPTEFEDLIAMVALYRPGPMELIPSYIKRKNGKEPVEYLHPKMENILKTTYGIMIYQEQLMQIAREMAGFTLGQADILRKAVGKKIKKLLMEQKEKLILGMIKNDVDKKIAQKIWDWILPFASYGFNRSHAASYATIAYETAWLKTHYPTEFMTALLTADQGDVERIAVVIDECKKMGITVLPPDVNESRKNFTTIKENVIRFGLVAVKNVGDNVVEEIYNERKTNGQYKSIADFVDRLGPKVLNKKSMESLIKAGAFDALAERNLLLTNLEQLLEHSREIQKSKTNGQKDLFSSLAGKITLERKIPLSPAPPAKNSDKLAWEKELLGLYVSSHPMGAYQKVFDKKTVPINKIDKSLVGKTVKVAGVTTQIKKIITKSGSPMVFMDIEDLTGKIEVVVFASIIAPNPAIFKSEGKIVVVTARVDNRNNDGPKLVAQGIEEIIEK